MRLQLSHALVWLNSNKISCIMRGICREFCRCLFCTNVQMMRTCAKKKHVASDRTRRENVPVMRTREKMQAAPCPAARRGNNLRIIFISCAEGNSGSRMRTGMFGCHTSGRSYRWQLPEVSEKVRTGYGGIAS